MLPPPGPYGAAPGGAAPNYPPQGREQYGSAPGGYPPGQQGNIVRPGDLDDAMIVREIAALALPATDPLSGKADGVVAVWRET